MRAPPAALLVATLAGTRPVTLRAQDAAPPHERSVEVGGLAHGVSAGFGAWRGGYLRAVAPAGPRAVLTLDALAQRAFRDAGEYAALSLRHQLTARAFVIAAGGAGTGRFALPRARADLLVGRSFGARRGVVLSAGASYVDAQALYTDRAVVGSAAWYASPSLVLELAGRVNSSTPGDVRSFRISPTLTRRLNGGRQLLMLRADVGTEAYQLLAAPGAVARGFSSSLVSGALRHRASNAWGATLQAEAYRNPYYTRAGLRAGVLRFW